MGKVLPTFDLGWPGAISRSVDDIVVSLKNAGNTPIRFGAPVFLDASGAGVSAFVTGMNPGETRTFEQFVGFAVRDPGKTPDTYPQGQDMQTDTGYQEGQWNPGEVVEVLVRGSISLRAIAGFQPGGKVYIRKLDGSLVAGAGAEGTTLLLQNVRCKNPQQGNGTCSEFVVTNRNVQ